MNRIIMKKIIEALKEEGELTVYQLHKKANISWSTVMHYLLYLLADNKIVIRKVRDLHSTKYLIRLAKEGEDARAISLKRIKAVEV